MYSVDMCLVLLCVYDGVCSGRVVLFGVWGI